MRQAQLLRRSTCVPAEPSPAVAAFDVHGRVVSHTTSFFRDFPSHALPSLSAAVRRLQNTSADRQVVRVGNHRVALQRLTGVQPVFVATVDRLPPKFVPLSPRQREVAQYAVTGATAVEIAKALHISSHTVRQHLKEVYRRLGVENRVQLSRVASAA